MRNAAGHSRRSSRCGYPTGPRSRSIFPKASRRWRVAPATTRRASRTARAKMRSCFAARSDMATREDVLRELGLAPTWRLRMPLRAAVVEHVQQTTLVDVAEAPSEVARKTVATD